ncbi:YciI family protein [Pinibacter soli]|uniref:YciI family protein n=1 Tax=Pinibacter soli TaxID=3044211 RepID=A0ABT6RIC7_9BACT|nr:YciI family protein [Pinibacter soli]MDI3322176.1 YciI family protein [Pinibacter soli]
MQFLVIGTDHKDAEALNRRLAVRPKHIDRMHKEKAKGHFIFGGSKLTDEGKMVGSILVIDLPDMEAAENWIEADPYVKDGVWETYEVVPFRVAEV